MEIKGEKNALCELDYIISKERIVSEVGNLMVKRRMPRFLGQPR